MIIAPTKPFLSIGGPDEVYSRWGVEDNGLYLLLSKVYEPRSIKASMVVLFDQSDSTRTENYVVESINRSEQKNELYRRRKSIVVSHSLEEGNLEFMQFRKQCVLGQPTYTGEASNLFESLNRCGLA